MKKITLFITLLFAAAALHSQSEKYVKAMENLVPAVDTTRSQEGLTELANSFERIANAEKVQWLPYYYAALCYINKANMLFQTQELDKIDPVVDLAEPLIQKAEELEKNNSEVLCLIKMFNSAKMMADPMNRYMTYGTAAAEALEKAKALNPENPRVYLLEGIDKFFTPEQFGGSKTEGKKLFEEASKKFESFKPLSSIHPVWGAGQVKYFLSM
ncbi:MAG: hypothetical protein IPH18_09220 [Chitinophagaceae bacterium]|nr:hypothetical protein [Chitinophagaceae bacterium]MBK8953152.1 hypothetical protein [Chitinophagaceae bacterium]